MKHISIIDQVQTLRLAVIGAILLFAAAEISAQDDLFGKEAISRMVSVYNHGSVAEADPTLGAVSRLVSVFNARYFGEVNTITFEPIPDQIYGTAPYALNAVASSGLEVTFRVVFGPARFEDGVLSLTGVGLVVVEAFQEGDDTYATAEAVRRTFLVTGSIALQRSPESINAAPGERIELSVEVDAAAPIRYQWRRNGEDLPGANGASYVINSVSLLDGGSYSVVVSNPAGTVESGVAVVRIVLSTVGFADAFADAGVITTGSEIGRADSMGATLEAGEPEHAGKAGGASMWVRWVAAEGGVAALSTLGSSFDTLLAVYHGGPVDALTEVAADEDSAGFLTSALRFNAVVGETYFIAVDGFDAATGEIVLSWELTPGASTPAITTAQQPESRTVAPGSTTVISADLQGPGLTFQWLRNGLAMAGETSSSLTILDTTPTDAGVYTLEIRNAAGELVSTRPARLDIGEDTDTVFEDKIGDALRRFEAQQAQGRQGLRIASFSASSISPTLGVPSSGTTDNTLATLEIGEPLYDQARGGASLHKFAEVPVDGTLRIDTIGSEIDTLLRISRYDFGTNELLALGEGDDGAADGHSIVRVNVATGDVLLISVDGRNNAQGRIQINSVIGHPPVLEVQPVASVVAPGDSVEVSVNASSESGDLTYQWYLRGAPLSGMDGSSLHIDAFDVENVGEYTVRISNPVDSIVSEPVWLSLDLGSGMVIRDWLVLEGKIQFELLVEDRSSVYVIESSSLLLPGDWRGEYSGTVLTGRLQFSAQLEPGESKRFFRVRTE